MYVVIDSVVYTDIYDIVFSPQISLLTNIAPVNFFTAKIKTTNTIPTTGKAGLYDDDGTLYALWYISSVSKIADNIYSVRAEDIMSILDTVTLRSDFIEQETSLSDMINRIGLAVMLATLGRVSFSVGAYQDDYIPVKGFLPQQSVRERLQYVAFAAGATLTTAFTEYDILIKKWDVTDTPIFIPEDRVYWKPTKRQIAKVTDITYHYYDFTETAAPDIGATDNFVSVSPENMPENTRYWYVFEYEYTHNLQQDDNMREAKIATNYLIGVSNQARVMANVILYYMDGNAEIVADFLCDDERPLRAGDYVIFSTGNGKELVYGYILEEDYYFGKQKKVRATVHIMGYQTGVELTIRHRDADSHTTLKVEKYLLPSGRNYYFDTSCIDYTNDSGERTIFYPLVDNVSGSILQDTTIYVDYDFALDFETGGIEAIYNVDNATESSGVVTIEAN